MRNYFVAQTEYGAAVVYQHAFLGLVLESEGTEAQCQRQAKKLNLIAQNDAALQAINDLKGHGVRRSVRYFENDLSA
jgi:hypothetical protein